MIIINADDFGYSLAVNDAIVGSFEAGLISSTTLMANMPGFKDACEKAADMGLANRIGIHLNLSEGRPLTDDIKKHRAFCDAQGYLCFKRETHFWLGRAAVAAVRRELQAQIDLCRASGLPLTHADSHHHVHAELPILFCLIPVLRQSGIRFLRITDNLRPVAAPRRIYKSFYNSILRIIGLRGTDYFGELSALERARDRLPRNEVVIETIVHPVLGPDGALIDAGSKASLADCVESVIHSYRLGSYADL